MKAPLGSGAGRLAGGEFFQDAHLSNTSFMVCSTCSALKTGRKPTQSSPFFRGACKAQCSCGPKPNTPASSPASEALAKFDQTAVGVARPIGRVHRVFQLPGIHRQPVVRQNGEDEGDALELAQRGQAERRRGGERAASLQVGAGGRPFAFVKRLGGIEQQALGRSCGWRGRGPDRREEFQNFRLSTREFP